MKFGLKLWSTNVNLIDHAIHIINEKIFDYIELFVIPGTPVSPFKFDLPFIIHIPHEQFCVNIGETSKKDFTQLMINESITWADELNAKYIILHAGYGSMENAKAMLHEIEDRRFLIENMPKVGLGGEAMIGHSPMQIGELIGDGDMGLCLDFGHAIKAAVNLGVDYRGYVKEFMGFEPKVFHVSDGRLDDERDEHLEIGKGEYDFEFLMGCTGMNNSGFVTIETPRLEAGSIEEDILNINKLKDAIKSQNMDTHRNGLL